MNQSIHPELDLHQEITPSDSKTAQSLRYGLSEMVQQPRFLYPGQNHLLYHSYTIKRHLESRLYQVTL
jgi:hypothetical protein